VLDDWKQVEPTNAELHAYLAAIEQEAFAAEAGDTDERQFRVDQGTSTLEGILPIHPIVSQTTSADSEPRAKR
ncbi:MAG TPA: hypothetical protein VE890_08005, partial [Thermoguttaceae bacterium]|nr:hypothetical protein [Thermoguttaceae bacterium]